MEHEDNAQFASFLQNTQNNNMNIAGANDGLGLDAGIGCGGVGIGIGVGGQGDIQVVGSVGGSASVGGKYDELDENRHFAADDDNEWKYISEVHQNEKEMQQKVASNGNNNNLHGAYNNDHDDNDDDDVDDDDDDADMPSMQYRKNNDITPNGNGEHLNGAANNHHHHELMDEFDINRADIGDFSTTSNTISTAEGGDIGGVQADLLHVEMNFENQHQTHQQQEQHQLHQQQQHDFEEEDPSSNCTSSLSENLPPQQQLQQLQQQQQQQGAGDQVLEEVNAKNLAFNDGGICDDKENADPFGVEEHGFLLNPDAKEFVPSFSSNPTSPTTSEPDHEHVGEPVEPAQFEQLENKQQQPQLSAISRHLLLAGDDEFIARSPRKGREMDIDGLAIPPSENEFEHEAAMRPHELEQEEDLIGDSSILIATGANDLPHDVAPVTAFETVENITTTTTTITTTTNNPIDNDDEEQQQMKQFNDGADYVMHDVAEIGENLQSPENLIDHDMEIDMMAAQNNHQSVNDVMKQSMYEENYNAHVEQEPEQIENILNSVQQLPTDNEGIDDDEVTTSQDDDEQGAKELLHDHDEKDHVSHPPSIEEMQLNLQNDFSASEKDIAQIPRDLDMNSAAHMQESFYMQQQQQLTEEEHQPEDAVVLNESLLLETSIPFDGNTSLMSPTTTTNAHHEQQAYDYNNDGFAARDPLLINTDFTTATKDMNYDEQQEQHAIDTNASSPSPHSTVEEKHLVEDTKEQMVAKVIDATQEFVDELEQKMENLLSSGLDDGHLKPNDEPFNPKEENFHEEQQHYENEQQIEEVQEQPIIPNEQKTNEITYEKQITVEATDIEPPAVEVVEKIHEEILDTQLIVEPTQPIEIDTDKLAIAAAAVAATGAAAAATAAKKTEPAVKKTSGVTPKSAVGTSSKAIKKPTVTAPTETSKKPAAKPSTDSARPRTAPSKTTTNTTSTASSARAGSATLAKRTSGVTSASSSTAAKSTGAGLTATRTVTKTTTTSARLTGATQRTITTSSTTTTTKTAATTAASLGARKSATSPTGVAKSRPSSSQPSKPAVLVAKPKISPRSTLSSQLRNKSAVPTSTTTTTTTTSSSASATNGITKSPLKTSTLTNGVATNKNPLSTRTKPTAASLAKAAPTKTFIARPAPKTNTSSSVPPTTTRRTLLQQASTTTNKPVSKTSPVKGSPSASKVAGSPRTTGSSMLRQNGQTKDAKSPITKPKTMTSAKSPIKSENAISKNGNLDNKPIEEKTSDEVAELAKSIINDQSAVGELAQNHDGINALQA